MGFFIYGYRTPEVLKYRQRKLSCGTELDSVGVCSFWFFAVIAQAVELGVANARIRAHVPVTALILYGGSLTESHSLQNCQMSVQIVPAVPSPDGGMNTH